MTWINSKGQKANMMKFLILIFLIYLLYRLLRPHPAESEKPITREYNGYIQFLDKNYKWKFLHRDIAEKKVGGDIWPGRVVHHRNGNKKNNDPSNLRIMREDDHLALHERYRRKRKRRWF
jgi:hypothetical protein